MSEITTDLKALRLHGMADAWTDWVAQGASSTASSRWLIEHLPQAETTDRAMRSVSHQMHAAKFPVHRDLVRISANVTDHFKNIVTGTFGEAKADKSYTNRSRTGARSAWFLCLNHAISFL